MSSECEMKSLRRTSKGMPPLNFGSRLMRENRISLVNAAGMVCSEMAAESIEHRPCTVVLVSNLHLRRNFRSTCPAPILFLFRI